MNIPFHTTTEVSSRSIKIFDPGMNSDEAISFCSSWIQNHLGPDQHFFFTKSCTQSLEMAIRILGLPLESEIIMPSYGFVALANAVVLNGHRCVFVDCEPDTMNICPKAITGAISERTKAVITINYGGVACDYGRIRGICDEHSLFLIEDNAHGLLSTVGTRPLGSFGDISVFSFDYMKNFSCYQGGGIALKKPEHIQRYRIVSENGTNRTDFKLGRTDHYQWLSAGTNTQLAIPLFSILEQQFRMADVIVSHFRKLWDIYQKNLQQSLASDYLTFCASLSDTHNGYMFWIKAQSKEIRDRLAIFLAHSGIEAVSHYTPLHNSQFGKKMGEFRGEDRFTSSGSDQLLRLPLYYALKELQVEYICQQINRFFMEHDQSVI